MITNTLYTNSGKLNKECSVFCQNVFPIIISKLGNVVLITQLLTPGTTLHVVGMTCLTAATDEGNKERIICILRHKQHILVLVNAKRKPLPPLHGLLFPISSNGSI